jgi:hypothetical protein
MAVMALKPGCTQAYTFNEVREYIEYLYSAKRSLRRIAREDFNGSVSHGAVQRVLEGVEPKDPQVRKAFGLPEYSFLVVVSDEPIPNGTQVYKAVQCISCGQWFIPNSPRRQRCFVCFPFKPKSLH